MKLNKFLSTRRAYGEKLIELGEKNTNIVVLDADLAFSTHTYMFAEKFTDRFFDFGLSEADMIATAGGLASCGKIVFASTFAVFAPGRCWDQIRMCVAYPNLSVKIVATHGGIATGADGYSHQAIEDIALMKLFPNMKVIVPADAIQTKKVIEVAAETPGPFYIRLVKPLLPLIYDEDCHFELGKANVLIDGSDVTLCAIGSMVNEAIIAQEILEKEKISARVIDFASVQPIDKEKIIEACEETKLIVSCEDHSIYGGLGDSISEVILSNKKIVPMRRIGIRDIFPESGSPKDLYEKYGLSGEQIAKKVKQWLK